MNNETVIPVGDAGLVLLYGHIPALFESLGLTKGDEFTDAEAQAKAVRYLQYAATGSVEADESQLALAKILCGLSPSEPLHNGNGISEEQAALIDGLISNATNDWQQTTGSSVNDFRGNWVFRLGTLTEHEEEWELEPATGEEEEELVEEHSGGSPEAKYPWMPKSAEAKYPWMPKGAERKYPWMPKDPEAKYPWMPKGVEGKYPWMPKGPEIKYPWMPKQVYVNLPEN